jgi:uncharacterized membrane protein YbhN (UPF0104 family)
MTLRRALAVLAVLTVGYLGLLAWADARGGVFLQGVQLWSLAPALLAASLLSWLIRYARWSWLFARTGVRCRAVPGLLAYLAGFAFTATPGKLGELVRIRYFAQQGVRPSTVVAAFVFERAMDLLAVLALASLFIVRTDVWLFVALFVLAFMACLLAAAFHPALLGRAAARLRRYGAVRLASSILLVRDGLVASRCWLTLPDIAVALACGLAAWGLTSWSFLYLLRQLTEVSPHLLLQSLAVYPLAMLAGAASMVPGGLGSTEVAIVALLAAMGVPVATAAVAAVGIRLSTLWFAIVAGLLSAVALELRHARGLAAGRLPQVHSAAAHPVQIPSSTQGP